MTDTTSNPREAGTRISVVVPVRNRSKDLATLLAAISRQAFCHQDIEVIVCDDDSEEDLEAVVTRHDAESDVRFIYLRQAPRQGPGAARNLGLTHASGEIIVFTDSDCVPAPEWLAELYRELGDPSVGIVGGKVDGLGAKHVSGQTVSFLMSSALGAAGARDPRSVIHMRFYPRTCNLAVRSDLARAVGGFPASFHGEDLEFSHKVLRTGASARFVPSAVVLHNEQRTLLMVGKEAFRKGAARIRLAGQHGLHEAVHALPALFVLYLGVLCTTAAVAGPSIRWLFIPLGVYGMLLAVLAIQGAVSLKNIAVGAVLPAYAVAMHLGYGLGYLRECLRALSRAIARRCRRRRSGATPWGVGLPEVDWRLQSTPLLLGSLVGSHSGPQEQCRIPYRIDLAGGWLDQPFVSRHAAGCVVVASVQPDRPFALRSGMATSTREIARRLWGHHLPHGNREENARLLFACENPPGTEEIAGSQDALGILLPGVNRLDYGGRYWPEEIHCRLDEDTLSWLERLIHLLPLAPRPLGFSVLADAVINERKARALADAADRCWVAIVEHDAASLGKAVLDSFLAQVSMFPNMVDPCIDKVVECFRTQSLGLKLTGAGGGGHLLLISEEPISGCCPIRIVRPAACGSHDAASEYSYRPRGFRTGSEDEVSMDHISIDNHSA